MLKDLFQKLESLFLPDQIQYDKTDILEKDIFVRSSEFGFQRFEKIMPEMRPLEVSTLEGLIDYIESPIDQKPAEMFLHIQTFGSVKLLGPQISTDFESTRHCYAIAKAPMTRIDNMIEQEQSDFIIQLKTKFEQTHDFDYLMKLVSTIATDEGVESSDNGMSQTVKTRRGIVTKEETEIKKNLTLAPFLTFPEIEQPARPCFFRLQRDMCMSLHFTDSPLWQQITKQKIAEFLENNIDLVKRGVKLIY